MPGREGGLHHRSVGLPPSGRQARQTAGRCSKAVARGRPSRSGVARQWTSATGRSMRPGR
eukprot:9450336-Alexandrium_andersonii.AAC.1